MEQEQLINAIKSNNSNALKAFYVTNYPKIESLVLSNSGTIDDAKDVYQDAFIALWNNIKNKAFIPANGSALNGYLYTIAKNKWMDTIRSQHFKKTQPLTKERIGFIKNEADSSPEPIESNQLNKAMEAFKNLGQPCKQLLTRFYFDKKSLRDIATDLSLDEASVRNKKYRCMEKLRSIALASK
ncbi:MAG TPA: sigma-70 family RNA polymerase sigma factor [Mariniflexile sp.]|nr:sigma-70 family RNA polymerase sigma factor [Mariniflexile sp.]